MTDLQKFVRLMVRQCDRLDLMIGQEHTDFAKWVHRQPRGSVTKGIYKVHDHRQRLLRYQLKRLIEVTNRLADVVNDVADVT